HGVEASDISGSGAGGRVTVDDVLAFVEQRGPSAAPKPAASIPSKQLPKEDEAAVAGRRVPHSNMRKRIAERMVESLLHTAPHVTTVFEADISAIIAHRAAHKEEFQR